MGKLERKEDMVRYFCDLCDKEVDKYNEYSLPIAATFINGEPCDLIQVPGFNLCKDCRSRLYGVVKSIVPKQKIEKLNKRALDIKMGRCDE